LSWQSSSEFKGKSFCHNERDESKSRVWLILVITETLRRKKKYPKSARHWHFIEKEVQAWSERAEVRSKEA
jgi:hypothetical protein